MIKVLKSLFEHSQHKSAESLQRAVRLAAAALLVETARADFTQSNAELDKLRVLLQTSLHLQADEVHELILAAQEQVEAATSLYEFTRVINEHCTAEQKIQLIGAMWTVAYADGNVDKYEEHLIRHVADLLYVPHSNYIHSKLAAEGQAA
jgi:uncharacterized tellurite resistance protein B-like protein